MDWYLLILFIILFIVLFIAIVITLTVSNSGSMLFSPSSDSHWVPDETVSSIIYNSKYEDEIDNYKTNSFTFLPMKFHGNDVWLLSKDPSQCQDRKIIFFCHGNSGNISQRRYIVEIACWFDVDVLLFDYQGFGHSHGLPTSYNICSDAQEIYYWLKSKYQETNIILWGESVGGAPSCYLAAKNNPGQLVLFSTFSSIDDVVDMSTTISSMWKYGVKIAKYVLNMLPNREWIKNVTCPTLIVHSPDDKLIDVRQAKINYEAIPHNNKQLLYITGDHSNPDMNVESVKQIYYFIHQTEMKNESADMCRKLVKKLIKQLRTNW